jgi:bacteriorhodopsin
MEFVVQIVEASFYVWMVYKFSQIKNITPFRYFDWMITTPTMLITLMLYLVFIRNREKGIVSESFLTEVKKRWIPMTQVAILDWLMLIAGYMGEIGTLDQITANIAGFLPFFMMFYIIYKNFVTDSVQGQKIFWYFAAIWGIYGVAAFMPYNIKNIMFNILDLFAKNFFGLFLAFTLYKVKI